MNKTAKMHDYLTSMDKYTQKLPSYLINPLSEDHILKIRSIIDEKINSFGLVDANTQIVQENHFQPRIMRDLSRLVVEFEFPKDVEDAIDKIIKPMYSENIKLSHFSYLGYDLKYSNNEVPPSLPPHIDAAETLITFNYQMGGNTEWTIMVDGEEYELKTGDAVIFSAVNQVHWRPKKIWKPGEFVEILTVNYSPLDNWRFTREIDPIHPILNSENRAKYMSDLEANARMRNAWDLYSSMGEASGIPSDKLGLVDLS